MVASNDFCVRQCQQKPDLYVTRLYEIFLHRKPTFDEQRYWISRFPGPSVDARLVFVRQFCQANNLVDFIPGKPDALPSQEYQGPPRIFVPNVRTVLVVGEPLEIEAIVLGSPAAEVTLAWRPLGESTFRQLPLAHIARGVYRARLALPGDAGDLEYYVEAKTAGAPLRFPPTAPELNQTVVVAPVMRLSASQAVTSPRRD